MTIKPTHTRSAEAGIRSPMAGLLVYVLIALGVVAALMGCESPTEPERGSVYDPGSAQFIASADLVTSPLTRIGAFEGVIGREFYQRLRHAGYGQGGLLQRAGATGFVGRVHR